ncbi:MAG: hypothetical protein V4760_18925 [Bdellovibrionota bacterium]
MITILFALLMGIPAFAAESCPPLDLKGFSVQKVDEKEAYVNAQKTVSFGIKCLPNVKPAEAAASIDFFPNVKPVKEKISYQELSSGTDTLARIYFDTRKGMIQLAVVAKFKDAKEKASIEADVLAALELLQPKKK